MYETPHAYLYIIVPRRFSRRLCVPVNKLLLGESYKTILLSIHPQNNENINKTKQNKWFCPKGVF